MVATPCAGYGRGMSDAHPFVPLRFVRRDPEEMLERAAAFTALMAERRTTRHFSTDRVDRRLITGAIEAAMTAPSGANMQPWTFVVVEDAEVKAKIRAAAEEEERQSYQSRMPQSWLDALAPLGTDEHKPHLTDAPYVVVLFRQNVRVTEEGERVPNYYVSESVGIAAGMFIAALHNMGLVTLTHTPSPMGFLSKILERPDTEKPYLLMPVGYPAPDAEVPDIGRKSLDDVLVWR